MTATTPTRKTTLRPIPRCARSRPHSADRGTPPRTSPATIPITWTPLIGIRMVIIPMTPALPTRIRSTARPYLDRTKGPMSLVSTCSGCGMREATDELVAKRALECRVGDRVPLGRAGQHVRHPQLLFLITPAQARASPTIYPNGFCGGKIDVTEQVDPPTSKLLEDLLCDWKYHPLADRLQCFG